MGIEGSAWSALPHDEMSSPSLLMFISFSVKEHTTADVIFALHPQRWRYCYYFAFLATLRWVSWLGNEWCKIFREGEWQLLYVNNLIIFIFTWFQLRRLVQKSVSLSDSLSTYARDDGTSTYLIMRRDSKILVEVMQYISFSAGARLDSNGTRYADICQDNG